MCKNAAESSDFAAFSVHLWYTPIFDVNAPTHVPTNTPKNLL